MHQGFSFNVPEQYWSVEQKKIMDHFDDFTGGEKKNQLQATDTIFEKNFRIFMQPRKGTPDWPLVCSEEPGLGREKFGACGGELYIFPSCICIYSKPYYRMMIE